MDLIGVCMPKIRSISAAVKEEYSPLEISSADDNDDEASTLLQTHVIEWGHMGYTIENEWSKK